MQCRSLVKYSLDEIIHYFNFFSIVNILYSEDTKNSVNSDPSSELISSLNTINEQLLILVRIEDLAGETYMSINTVERHLKNDAGRIYTAKATFAYRFTFK